MNTSETIQPQPDAQIAGNKHKRSIGKIIGYEVIAPSRYLVLGEHANLAVEAVTERVVRLVPVFTGNPDWSTTPAVVSAGQEPVAIALAENSVEKLRLQCGDVEIIFDKNNGEYQAGLHQELPGESEPLIARHRIEWEAKGAVACVGQLLPDSRVYGLGETTGFLNKRGEKYVMWNSDIFDPHVPDMESLYQSIPLLIHFESGRAYGVFFDNPGRLTFDMRSSEEQYKVQASTGTMDHYLIFGPTLKDVIAGYTSLTGRMSMPPLWAIGYHQSRYSYKSQEELLGIARKFREKQIPCDALYLDIHYMNEYRVFTFDPEQYPDPKSMMEELAGMGFHVVPIVDPGVKKDPGFSVYKEGVLQDHFARKLEGDLFIGRVWPGDSAFPDFSKPSAREWWGGLHSAFTELGVRGIWNDMNEPSVFDCELKTMDLDVMLDNGGHPKTHEEIHNLYGFLMSQATNEGLRSLLDGERPFVVTRAGYAGIQRYAAVWTGDNRSYWDHLAMSIPMMINLGLSGIAFSGADIGGFSHHTSGELLARWTQLGVFSPFCRNHSLDNTLYQEPWRFGECIESICRDYINLRYRWMPYLYNQFREAAETGIPIIRPLVLEYPDDEAVYNLCDQFLFGADVLVAPVYRPDMTHRSVYLPRGEWYDYWSGERLEGGRYILAAAPLEKIPLYVRAGAVLPEQPVRQYAHEPLSVQSPDAPLTLILYASGAGGHSSYDLYQDDGLTFAYENGGYNVISIEADYEPHGVNIKCGFSTAGYEFKCEFIWIKIKYLGFSPNRVTHGNQKSMPFFYDKQTDELTVKLEIMGRSLHTISIN